MATGATDNGRRLVAARPPNDQRQVDSLYQVDDDEDRAWCLVPAAVRWLRALFGDDEDGPYDPARWSPPTISECVTHLQQLRPPAPPSGPLSRYRATSRPPLLTAAVFGHGLAALCDNGLAGVNGHAVDGGDQVPPSTAGLSRCWASLSRA